jgi:glycosyltransferase involved in cell wall biosynthesis
MTAATAPARLRVAMFVYNDVTRDSRVLREAKSLADAGLRVTVIGRPRSPDERSIATERRDGFTILLVPMPHVWRTWWYRFRKPWRMRGWIGRRFMVAVRRGPAGWPKAVAFVAVAIGMVVLSLIRLPFIAISGGLAQTKHDSTFDWLIRWRFGVLGWAATASAAAPPADVYHGHDLTGLPAAVRARDRAGGLVVYDSHESFMDSGSNDTRPRWAKAIMRRYERNLARRAAALVTVNQSIGALLGARFGQPRVVVTYNTPARWDPQGERPDLLREAAEVPPGTPVALYHGAFSAHRGLAELADALLEPGMADVHAVYLGYGSLEPALRELAADPRFGGRLHVLKAVPPDVLPAWIASADVGVMAIGASTLNHRLSSPNKLFESIATGLPVVVSDFVEMRRIVLDDPAGPLGAVCDPADPASIAAAIRSILDLRPAERADLRARCLRAAHDRWNWETESAKLVALYSSLADELAAAAKPAPD